MKKFSKSCFKSPAAEFQPGYFWILNSKLKLEELFDQLHEMATKGAYSVCLHPMPKEFRHNTATSMAPSFLSDEYQKMIAAIVEECNRLGMNYYLYDEGGWPSGSACGQVWKSDPTRFSQQFVISDSKGGAKIIREEAHPELSAPYPNVLEPGVTEKFLELSYESAAKWFGKHFGKTIHIAFTDEPHVPPPRSGILGWCSDFAEEFHRRKGYDIYPWLPKLLEESSSMVDRVAEVRMDYHDLLSQLFTERFLLPLRNWCRVHGLRLGGHFGGEDEWFRFDKMGFGHIMRSLRCLDVPGVDMIWRQLYPGLRLHPFPKLASSIAHQNGGNKVLGELFAIYGSGLTPDVMKYLLDYMLCCGVNTFIFSSFSQSLREGRMSGGRPHFGPVDPLWKYFDLWHEYVGRMSYLLTCGRPAIDTVLYFDMRAMWLGGRPAEYSIMRSHEAAWRLQARQIDFDYVDDDALLGASVQKGILHIGEMRYANLVVPAGCLFPSGVSELLKQFRKFGVRVLDPDEISSLSPSLGIEPATDKLRVCQRDFGDRESGYFLFNISKSEVRVRLNFPERGSIAVADAETGEMLTTNSADGELDWCFKPWESRFFISGREGELPAQPQPGPVLQNLTKWTLRPLTVHRAGEYDFSCECLDGEAVKVELGDWRGVFGKDFSGDGVYSTSFTCDLPEKCVFLDLGCVRYACSVRLNGQMLGKRLWEPFVFFVRGMLIKGKNRLDVTVSNTLANAVSSDAVLDRWLEKYPPESPYERTQRLFERESLSAGLFGPVSLLTAVEKADQDNNFRY